jgi:hypothetical protein
VSAFLRGKDESPQAAEPNFFHKAQEIRKSFLVLSRKSHHDGGAKREIGVQLSRIKKAPGKGRPLAPSVHCGEDAGIRVLHRNIRVGKNLGKSP